MSTALEKLDIDTSRFSTQIQECESYFAFARVLIRSDCVNDINLSYDQEISSLKKRAKACISVHNNLNLGDFSQMIYKRDYNSIKRKIFF